MVLLDKYKFNTISYNSVEDRQRIMPYILLRNQNIVQHIIMVGPKNDNFRESKVVDLKFETLEAANEVAEVLKAEVKAA